MKKHLRTFLCLLALILGVVGLVACDTGGSTGGNQQEEPDVPAVQVNITYDANGGLFEGGTALTQIEVSAGSLLTAPAAPAWEYHTFVGWAKEKTGETAWNFSADTITADTTLYAIWSQESAVVFEIEGIELEDKIGFLRVEKTVSSLSFSDKVVCSTDSEWKLYRDEGATQEVSNKTASLSNGDNLYYLVVTAKDGAKSNTYELKIHRSYSAKVVYYNGESALKTEYADTGKEFTASYTPTITGYDFNAWNTEAGTEYAPATLWGELKLYAQTTAKTYQLTYDVNGGDALASESKEVVYNGEYTLEVPTRTGHTFQGWYIDTKKITDETGVPYGVWTGEEDTTVQAKWSTNSYPLTVRNTNTQAGYTNVESNRTSFPYGMSVTVRAVAYSGYIFLGWYENGEVVSNDLRYTFQTGVNTILTARWTTVSFHAEEGGSVPAEGGYYVGQEVTVEAVSDEGYTFLGWYNGSTKLSSELAYTFTVPNVSVNYTAKWTYYTVKIIREIASDTYEIPTRTIEQKVTANTERTISSPMTGLEFIGLYEDGTLLTDSGDYTFTMPTENVVYTEKWKLTNDDYLGSYLSLRVDKAGNESATGEYLLYGSFPQSQVTNSTLITQLQNLAGATPTNLDFKAWSSFNYYKSGSQSHYAFYQDVTYEGEKYRAVYFTENRPNFTEGSVEGCGSAQADNGYTAGNRYFFKFEPIKWRILEEENGLATIQSETLLTSMQYFYTDGSPSGYYANNYEKSNLRGWMNNGFYEQAFGELEQSLLQTVTVDNGKASTGSSSNQYACNDTEDKVWALSKVELDSYYPTANDKIKYGSDYALCQGLNISSSTKGGSWWTRSPHSNGATVAQIAQVATNPTDFSDEVTMTFIGVSPVVQLKLF